MNLNVSPQLLLDGRCAHCYVVCQSTGGCITCNSSRMFCTCGALLRCGCGMIFEHDPTECPNIITPRVIEIPATYSHDVVTIPINQAPLVFSPDWNLLQ